MYEILKDAYDLHVHSAPDVVARKYTDLQLAKLYIDANMRGFVIKSHQFNTGGRAKLVKEIYPKINVIGAIALNRSMGDLNPVAVEMAARIGAKVVWFPTVDSASEQEFNRTTGKPKSYGAGISPSIKIKPITILDSEQNLLPEVYNVLEVIKSYDMILSTGHISKQETLALLKAGSNMGINKMVVTHPEFPACLATIEEQKEYINQGALIEHCYHTLWSGDASYDDISNQIKEIGAENIILTSDLGQVGSPDPIEGLVEFASQLMKKGGITKRDIKKMIVCNPTKLVE